MIELTLFHKPGGILSKRISLDGEGDAYGGSIFKFDFERYGISFQLIKFPRSSLYEHLEVPLNAREIELLDDQVLIEQLLGLVMRGSGKIDHPVGSGFHDDRANAVAGVISLLSRPTMRTMIGLPQADGFGRISWRDVKTNELIFPEEQQQQPRRVVLRSQDELGNIIYEKRFR